MTKLNVAGEIPITNLTCKATSQKSELVSHDELILVGLNRTPCPPCERSLLVVVELKVPNRYLLLPSQSVLMAHLFTRRLQILVEILQQQPFQLSKAFVRIEGDPGHRELWNPSGQAIPRRLPPRRLPTRLGKRLQGKRKSFSGEVKVFVSSLIFSYFLLLQWSFWSCLQPLFGSSCSAPFDIKSLSPYNQSSTCHRHFRYFFRAKIIEEQQSAAELSNPSTLKRLKKRVICVEHFYGFVSSRKATKKHLRDTHGVGRCIVLTSKN